MYIEHNNTTYKHEIDKYYDVNILYEHNFDKECIRNIILTDTYLIPLRFHDNLITELANRKIPISNKKTFL